MSERKYTVAEIDEMRGSVFSILVAPMWSAVPERAHVEDVLRTYMINGTDPAELKQAAQLAQEAAKQRYADYESARAWSTSPTRKVFDGWVEAQKARLY